jgi:uncharacterized protein YegP (UPF0339 family)
MKFEAYRGIDSGLYFRLVDNLGKILLISEGHGQKENVLNNIQAIKNDFPSICTIEKIETKKGVYFFKLKNADGHVIVTSTAFNSAEMRDEWLKDLQKEATNMQIVDHIN